MKSMRSARKITSLVAVIALVIAFSLFAFQNSEPVEVTFMRLATPRVPMFIILFAVFLLGVAATGIFCFSEMVRLGTKCRRQERVIRTLDKQIDKFKQQPLIDEYGPSESANDESESPAETAKPKSGKFSPPRLTL